MKLSKAQQKYLERMQEIADSARTLSFEEWVKKEGYGTGGMTERWRRMIYENAKNGIVWIRRSNVKTVKRLREYGLIERVEGAWGERLTNSGKERVS